MGKFSLGSNDRLLNKNKQKIIQELNPDFKIYTRQEIPFCLTRSITKYQEPCIKIVLYLTRQRQ